MKAVILALIFTASASAQAVLTVDAGPDLFVSAPIGNGATPVTLAAVVRENGNLVSRIRVDWTKLEGPGEFTVDDPGRAITTGHFSIPGVYRVRATASDYPPQPVISYPVDGASYKTQVTINASASDDVGIAKMEVYFDGDLLATFYTASVSQQINLRPKKVRVGPHQVIVMAYDTAGLRGWETITVNKAQ